METRYRLRFRDPRKRKSGSLEWWSKVLTLKEMVKYLGYAFDNNGSELIYIVRFRIKTNG